MSSEVSETAGRAAAVGPAGHSVAKPSLLRQPKSVWAVAFACAVSFMGIGLVDPILPTMAAELHATPSQVSLLFTSYLLVTAVAMLITGWVSSRIGAKRTLIAGLVVIVAFSALAGFSGGVEGIIGFRAGWGLGNALFIATSLAVIVGAASGGFRGAIVLYESALGLGIALGPLVGGLLGGLSWRGPFFGVSVLMALALIAAVTLLAPTPTPPERMRISAPLRALRHRGLRTVALTALLYNWGFFTILGYAPYPMKIGVHALGFVFFGWGVLVAIFAVFVAPRVQRAIGTAKALYLSLLLLSLDIAAIAVWVDRSEVIMACVIASGAFIGMNNTLVTASAMSVSPVPPPTASAAYSFVRFLGGGLAPWVAGILAARYGYGLPFSVGAGAVFVGMLVLATAHRLLDTPTDHAVAAEAARHGDREAERELDSGIEQLLESAEGELVHGYVTTHGGVPVGAAVCTLIDPTGRECARGVSAPDGYYNVTAPAPGRYVLVTSATGFHPSATAITLARGPLDYSPMLTANAVLRGVVTASTSGHPLPGANVVLLDGEGGVVTAVRSTDHGEYAIGGVASGGVASGDYTLVASCDNATPAVRAVRIPATGEAVANLELIPL